MGSHGPAWPLIRRAGSRAAIDRICCAAIFRRSSEAGFTLIEALVALAVLAVSLTAIGSVVAANVRGTRSLGERLALVETTRAILTDLPDREQIVSGRLSGEFGAHRWRVDVLPFSADFIAPSLLDPNFPDPGFIDANRPAPWTPQIIAVSVRSPSGRVLRVDTVRLHRWQAGEK